MRDLAQLLLVTGVLFAARAQEAGHGSVPGSCGTPPSVGLRVVSVTSVQRMAVWYPSADRESEYSYAPGIRTKVARNGAVSKCGRVPLVMFSHGLGGCGIQSVFFTEELARHGYVVAAPDHKDAGCSSDGTRSLRFPNIEQSLFHPETWDEATYADRKSDLELGIRWLLESPDFEGVISQTQIGVAGHSLGGYVALGLAGAWRSWTDPRIKAVLVFSPYAAPFLIRKSLERMDVPVMYQGAAFDIFITPSLRGDNGAYAVSNPPKYYVELRGGNHFEWTNLLCAGTANPAACIHSKPNAELISDYGIAFLDKYLKAQLEPLLHLTGRGLVDYKYVTGR